MKALKALLICLLVLGFAIPTFAAHLDDDERWRFNIDTVSYEFDWEVASDYVGGTDDTIEFFDDNFDTTQRFNKGDLEVYYELEVADNNLGDDNPPQPLGAGGGDWEEALGNYSAKWTPESMADREFRLEVGDFGTGYGKRINNDDSPHGSIELGWKMGDVGLVLGYGRNFEGNINDDTEGDGHLMRGQVSLPLGESGFSLGVYAAFYNQNDVNIQAASDATVDVDEETGLPTVIAPRPDVQGDQSVFLGSAEIAGAVGNVDVYAEIGFSNGSQDFVENDVPVDTDLSGFYIMGGANFNLGQVSLGIEGGFSPGDDDPNDNDIEAFIAVNEDFAIGQILHDEDMIAKTSPPNGGTLSNLWYLQGTVGLSPSEKLGLSGSLLYLAPAEDVVSFFTGETVDSYGVELFGQLSYQIAEGLTFYEYVGVAFPDDDFVEDTQFQLTSRLHFLF
jgi:hypothetical protein